MIDLKYHGWIEEEQKWAGGKTRTKKTHNTDFGDIRYLDNIAS